MIDIDRVVKHNMKNTTLWCADPLNKGIYMYINY